MTESDWAAIEDPREALLFIREHASERQLRLAACAFASRIRRLLKNPEVERAFETAERFADGLCLDEERSNARKIAQAAVRSHGITIWRSAPKHQRRAASTVYWTAARDGNEAARGAQDLAIETLVWSVGGPTDDRAPSVREIELKTQSRIIRDIFGNPFRPVAFDARWRTSDVVGLARAIYDDRAFERMPILADALMDAGCEDEAIVSHCRGDGPHVRGCWVVDLLLGKE